MCIARIVKSEIFGQTKRLSSEWTEQLLSTEREGDSWLEHLGVDTYRRWETSLLSLQPGFLILVPLPTYQPTFHPYL